MNLREITAERKKSWQLEHKEKQTRFCHLQKEREERWNRQVRGETVKATAKHSTLEHIPKEKVFDTKITVSNTGEAIGD